MTKDQKEYILGQLDKMAEELEEISDVAKRAEVRGKYIELFIDLCTVSNTQPDIVHEEELVEDEVIEDDVLEEDVEEPESVTAETEAIIEEEIQHRGQVVQEVKSNIHNSDEIFEDAEVVREVENENGETVDITTIYNELIEGGLDSETADSIGLFLTEQDCIETYNGKFGYMEHGLPRAYAAYLGKALTEEQLIAYIIDFSNLDLGAVKSSTDFIDDANAEALFDFVCQ